MIYEDHQKFGDKGVIGIVIAALIPVLAIVVYLVSRVGDPWLPLGLVFLGLIFSFGVIAFLRLSVKVDQAGVHFKYVPFHFSEQLIPWSDIQEIKVTSVNAIGDFGGVGIRYRFTPKKKGFIMNSGPAIEVLKNDGRVIVVTISNPEKAQQAIAAFQI